VRRVRGRITEEHLPLAEETFPGICAVYAQLSDKPATFLQLVWIYEGLAAAATQARRPRPRGRRAPA
jgi:hypothetical protein